MVLARLGRARTAHVAGALVLILCWDGRGVRADTRYRVVLARPTDADPVTREALARVSGELEAGGFDLRVVDIPRDADPRNTVETVGKHLDPAAAFAIFPGVPSVTGGSTAEIWVCDRLTGRATVQRLRVDPQDADRVAAVLAVHAVELLKASLAELWVTDADRRARRRLPADREPSGDRLGDRSGDRSYALTGIGIEGAGGLIAHPGGFARAWTPAVKLSFGMPNGFAARLDVAGAGETLQVSNSAGTARLRQQMATVDIVAAFRPGRRIQPVAMLVAGAYRLGVAGTGAPGFLDRSDQSWAFVTGAGGGVVIRLWNHVALDADVRALGFWPRPAVRLGDTEVGQVGQPALVMTAGIVGVL